MGPNRLDNCSSHKSKAAITASKDICQILPISLGSVNLARRKPFAKDSKDIAVIPGEGQVETSFDELKRELENKRCISENEGRL